MKSCLIFPIVMVLLIPGSDEVWGGTVYPSSGEVLNSPPPNPGIEAATCNRWQKDRDRSLYKTNLSSKPFNLTLSVDLPGSRVPGMCICEGLQEAVQSTGQNHQGFAQLSLLTSCPCHTFACFPTKCLFMLSMVGFSFLIGFLIPIRLWEGLN